VINTTFDQINGIFVKLFCSLCLGINKYTVRAGARNSFFYSTFCFYCLQI